MILSDVPLKQDDTGGMKLLQRFLGFASTMSFSCFVCESVIGDYWRAIGCSEIDE